MQKLVLALLVPTCALPLVAPACTFAGDIFCCDAVCCNCAGGKCYCPYIDTDDAYAGLRAAHVGKKHGGFTIRRPNNIAGIVSIDDLEPKL